MTLQDQVGRELSLPTQISPPYSHQSQGTVERFHKTLYVQVRAIKVETGTRCSFWNSSGFKSSSPHALHHSACGLHDQPVPHSSGWKDLMCAGFQFNIAHLGPLVQFGECVLAHVQSQPPSQKLVDLPAQPQKNYSLWVGKRVITGMHSASHSGQILKTRTHLFDQRTAIQFCGIQQDHLLDFTHCVFIVLNRQGQFSSAAAPAIRSAIR